MSLKGQINKNAFLGSPQSAPLKTLPLPWLPPAPRQFQTAPAIDLALFGRDIAKGKVAPDISFGSIFWLAIAGAARKGHLCDCAMWQKLSAFAAQYFAIVPDKGGGRASPRRLCDQGQDGLPRQTLPINHIRDPHVGPHP